MKMSPTITAALYVLLLLGLGTAYALRRRHSTYTAIAPVGGDEHMEAFI